jgi:hypothetical protein
LDETQWRTKLQPVVVTNLEDVVVVSVVDSEAVLVQVAEVVEEEEAGVDVVAEEALVVPVERRKRNGYPSLSWAGL